MQNPINPKYSGTIQGLKSIWGSEGIRGFFKGNGTNCARIVPNSAVKFYSYEQASRFVLSVCLIYAFVLSVTELFLNLKWLIGLRILHVQMHLYLL